MPGTSIAAVNTYFKFHPLKEESLIFISLWYFKPYLLFWPDKEDCGGCGDSYHVLIGAMEGQRWSCIMLYLLTAPGHNHFRSQCSNVQQHTVIYKNTQADRSSLHTYISSLSNLLLHFVFLSMSDLWLFCIQVKPLGLSATDVLSIAVNGGRVSSEVVNVQCQFDSLFWR